MFDLQEILENRLKALKKSKQTDETVVCIPGSNQCIDVSKSSIVESLSNSGLMSKSGKIKRLKVS